MGYTTLGCSIYAVGGNAEAARLSGIEVGKIKITVMVSDDLYSPEAQHRQKPLHIRWHGRRILAVAAVDSSHPLQRSLQDQFDAMILRIAHRRDRHLASRILDPETVGL